MAIATWLVPAGQYEYTYNEILGKQLPVPGTYQTIASSPQGPLDIALAPIAGFYDPDANEVRAMDIALFVLIVGGFLGVVTRSGAIDAGIAGVMIRLKGREKWIIPILMSLFAAGGTVYGMASETLAFYPLIIPVLIAARYDALTGVAVIMIGAGVGVLGSTINPFATIIASNAADVPFTDGIVLRFALLFACWLASVWYVMRYAERVRKDPQNSLVADREDSNRAHFLKVSTSVSVRGPNPTDGSGDGTDSQYTSIDKETDLTFTRRLILIVFGATFAIMIWGVSMGGWWMAQMSALFLVSAILIGLIARLSELELTSSFVDGAKEMLGVALVIGLARGIVVVMDAGSMTDTMLYWAEQSVSGLSEILFINAMFGIQALLSFLIPSSSGLAVLTMPIMGPLGDFAGVSRDLVVTAFQSASGLVNFFNPTFAVVMGGLAAGRVPYERWVRFLFPLLLILVLIICTALSIGTLLG